jgi:anaerobic selenocysteine-containing dehydrogenase
VKGAFPSTAESWRPAACILCSRNCGIEVELEAGHLRRIRGDERHPLSQGYLCQKAARLDHYQNHADRIQTPLRRRPSGELEPVSWETLIGEVAEKLKALRDAHGGRALAYYGGGGQGNILTSAEHRDPITATPYHKYVPVRLRPRGKAA